MPVFEAVRFECYGDSGIVRTPWGLELLPTTRTPSPSRIRLEELDGRMIPNLTPRTRKMGTVTAKFVRRLESAF